MRIAGTIRASPLVLTSKVWPLSVGRRREPLVLTRGSERLSVKLRRARTRLKRRRLPMKRRRCDTILRGSSDILRVHKNFEDGPTERKLGGSRKAILENLTATAQQLL